MEGSQTIQVQVHHELEAFRTDQEKEEEEENISMGSQPSVPPWKKYKRWLRISLYAFFVLSFQAIATLLGRLYYQNGGKSKWMGTLVQLIGFPILFLFSLFSRIRQPETACSMPLTFITIGPVYMGIGLLASANCYLSSYGLLYLPVSTYSLISASQLAFTAFFSYFLNSQKFTPFILNSLFLLTISSTLLVFNGESENAEKVSKGKYAIGFLCTVGASAGNGLLFSLVQLILRKVLKQSTFSVVIGMVIYQSLVATCLVLVGLFASGEWRTLAGEMQSYRPGKVSYVMTLVWTAISWQVFTVGVVGLIFESSSVFSNAITAVGLPIVPILAVIVFHDKMDGLKVISMVLAGWGFVSFVYQHYLDDKTSKASDRNREEEEDNKTDKNVNLLTRKCLEMQDDFHNVQ
ncbi:PREDICTED: probable purine permease 8 [Tarenaya hassleriana]|uniref:probable purine permease 8 n=1 Tax=Tarenaya hassleriana TaxID=28532 RepID=UPI00053C3BEA|nr:PREDICTED: probable purine permease 8 [Tarenaya hassleriana]